MAGIFSGLDTPKWLGPIGGDEGTSTQFAEQIGRNFSEGIQRAKEAPLLKAKIAGAIMDVQRQQNMLDYQTQAKAGEVALSGALSDIAKSGKWNDPTARSSIFDVGTKFPAVMDTKAWQQIISNFDKSDKASAEAERYKSQAQQAEDRLKIAQERIDQQGANATENQRIQQERIDLAKEKQTAAEKTDAQPNEKVLDDGTKLVWMPGSKTVHVFSGKQEKEMSPLQLESISKALLDKDGTDTNGLAIMDFLGKKATGQIAKDKPAAAKTAMGGYKVNTIYKGGLKYLGGDPKDQNNWEKVQ
jgi:hypothetical protein